MLLHAILVKDYREKMGHWPDILFVDPTCLQYVSAELDILAAYDRSVPSISIRHDSRIPAGWAVACDLTDFLNMDAQFNSFNFTGPYEPRFTQAALQ